MLSDGQVNESRIGLMLLTALLLANPFVLFAVSGNLWITFGGFLLTTLALLLSVRLWGMGVVTAYLVNGLALASIFVHAELVFRFRFTDYAIEDLYTRHDGYYFNKPLLQKQLRDKEYAADYLTNRDGWRIGYSQDPERTFGDVDWLFLGDSFTQGAQVAFEDLYTSVLYRDFPDRIIANAGISGFGLPEEYEFFVQKGVLHNPSLVVLQVSGFNDFMKVERRHYDFSDYLVERSEFARFLLQDIKYQNPASLPLGRWAEPFYPDEETNRKYNIFYKETSLEKERDLQRFAEYLSRLHRAVDNSRARLLVVLLPTKEQVQYRSLEEVVTGFALDATKLDMSRPNRVLQRLADSLGFGMLDLLETFETSAQPAFFEYDEHLTPEGHRLVAQAIAAYLRSTGEGSKTRILSTDYHGDRYPSPVKGQRAILFQAPADGNSELFIAHENFQRIERLTTDDVDQAHPVLSPSGDAIAFTEGDQSKNETEVVLSRPDGSGRVVLTAAADVFGAIPDFSADGQRVTYAAWHLDSASNRMSEPRIVVADRRSDHAVTVSPAGLEAWRPVFSPDGDAIAYIRREREGFDLFLYDLRTRQERRLTETPYDEWDPRFSENGRSLVYAARKRSNWDLFLFDIDAGRTRQLTATSGDEWDPSFSEDGTQVLFGGEYGIFRGIYVIDLDPEN